MASRMPVYSLRTFNAGGRAKPPIDVLGNDDASVIVWVSHLWRAERFEIWRGDEIIHGSHDQPDHPTANFSPRP